MNGDCSNTTRNRRPINGDLLKDPTIPVPVMPKKQPETPVWKWRWSMEDVVNVFKFHPIPCLFVFLLFFFMRVEYTLLMIPPSSPPFDLGFQLTRPIHLILANQQLLNSILAGLNTVFVLMQTTYILWTWIVEARPRATIATLFMFSSRGILGYCTQLPLPEGFLGSGVDFPVGNVSFFLFFSGHVAGAIISSLDMRRVQRWEMAWLFDLLNVLQMLRLLGTRGHYTIDLAVGVGAGILFDSLAAKYLDYIKGFAAPGVPASTKVSS